MTFKQLAAIAVATTAAAALAAFAAADPSRKTWTFDSDRVDAPPPDFTLARTGGGAQGRWVVRRERGAPSSGNDEDNYYVARANALEDNVRLYRVKAGGRQQLASWSGEVSAGHWHDLRVEARGDDIQVSWEGQKVIDARDDTFPEAGRVGVWTKADSLTLFDDLSVEAF